MFSPAFGEFVNRDARNLACDPEQAKQLLREAGFVDQDNDGMLEKKGEPFRVTLTYDGALADDRLVAEYFQHEFREMGIEVILNPVERGLMRDKKSAGDFDLLLSRQWFIPHNEPSNNYRQYFYSSEGRFCFLNDPKVDALIDQLDAAGDRAERLKFTISCRKKFWREPRGLPLQPLQCHVYKGCGE
jgi:peptide/nickel transport system substrate-binding protein